MMSASRRFEGSYSFRFLGSVQISLVGTPERRGPLGKRGRVWVEWANMARDMLHSGDTRMKLWIP